LSCRYSPDRSEPAATRQHSQAALSALAAARPGLLGGSADLAGSNLTLMKEFGELQRGSPEVRSNGKRAGRIGIQ
jgi:transketolase